MMKVTSYMSTYNSHSNASSNIKRILDTVANNTSVNVALGASVQIAPKKANWPPFDNPPDMNANQLTCDMKAKFFSEESSKKFQNTGDAVVRFRSDKLKKWYSDGCKQWGLDGEWKLREDRKIYYAFAFGGEMEVLTVVLEEIYPHVDYIIIVEGAVTWRGDAKPLFFQPRNETHFSKYLDKIRYFPYEFDDPVTKKLLDECMTSDPVGLYGPGQFTCRWIRQWRARDFSAEYGAHDIGPNDVFIMADLDELLAREFIRALKYCDIWPDPNEKEKCGRVGVFTFGHRYHFSCSIAKNNGHFHPDLVLGRCLGPYGGEEVRRNFNERKKYKKRPSGLVEAKYVGPAGWHMHSFLSTAQVAWKWFSRSGNSKSSWTVDDLAMIKDRRKNCHDDHNFMKLDVRACEPIPHIIRENPKAWAHFLGYVDDEEHLDEFDVESYFRANLLKFRATADTAELHW